MGWDTRLNEKGERKWTLLPNYKHNVTELPLTSATMP